MKPTIAQISRAINNGEDFFQNIKLPSRQKTGTTYQIKSFSKLCATRLFNKNFKDPNREAVL